MKLDSYTPSGKTKIGSVRGDYIVELGAYDADLQMDMVSLLQSGQTRLLKAVVEVVAGSICQERY